MKEALRWSVKNGAGLAWPRGWATPRGRTSVLCCVRTTRGLSTRLRCSSRALACRYRSAYSCPSFFAFPALKVIGCTADIMTRSSTINTHECLLCIRCFSHYMTCPTIGHMSHVGSCRVLSSSTSRSTTMAKMWTKSTSRTPSLCDSLCSRLKWAAMDAGRTAASQTWVRAPENLLLVHFGPFG